MMKPDYLKAGDKVMIVATARKVSREEMKPAIEKLTSWGLDVVESEHLYASENQYAGNDDMRRNDMQMALDSDDIKAVICARGGYGTVRIIDALDFSRFREKPKWIVGYSDVTALHSHIQNKLGIESIHGVMPINFPADGLGNEAIRSLKSALFGTLSGYSVSGHIKNRRGIARGVLTGGNLSMLYSIMGTESQCDTKGKILFIEDLDEYLYHIDRMMMNLKRSGMLDGLAGIIIGGMTDMNDNTIPFGKEAEEIVAEHIAGYDYPVCFGFPAGHCKDNRALYMGREAELIVGEASILNF